MGFPLYFVGANCVRPLDSLEFRASELKEAPTEIIYRIGVIIEPV